MFINYLKLIFRKLFSKPLYPFISIFGLVTGFSAVLLVSLWIRDEISYDRFHPKVDRTYRLTVEIEDKSTGFHWNFARSWYGWLRNMPSDVPGVEKMVRLVRLKQGIVKVDERTWKEEIFNADSSLPDIFGMQFIAGDVHSCLSHPHQVILSESYARKYFGNEDPVDKTVYLYSSYTTEKTPFQVTGVFRDLPPNTHVHFNVVASHENPDEDFFWAYYYIVTDEKTRPKDILAGFQDFALKYVDENEMAKMTPHLQKISDIHLKSDKDRELEKNGSAALLKIIGILALFVLFITLFNFFNLRYVFLLRDTRPFKIFRFAGAHRGSIFLYQFSESIAYAVMAGFLSMTVVWIVYPYFNLLMGKNSLAGMSHFLTTTGLFLVVLILMAALAGILPLMLTKLSGFINDMAGITRTSATSVKPDTNPRLLKSLVGIQYISTFILIIAVVVVHGQVRLFMKNSLGNDKEKLLCLKGVPVQAVNRYQVFKEELLKSPLIQNVTSSMQNPGEDIRDMMGFETTGIDADTGNKLIYVSPVDDNFFDFYDIPIVAGNNFPEYNGDDSLPESFILNEKAVEYLGWNIDEAVGRPFHLKHQYTSKKFGRIVGVVKDFQPSTMKEEIHPYVFFQKSYWLYSAQIRYDTVRTGESLDFISNTWNSIYPDFPMEYEFVDNLYREIYKGEMQLRDMSIILCILALILSATGLFGITGITYEARTKEIGIRKVSGARTSGIMQWLLHDILIVVSMALLLGIPLSYFLAISWLKNYVYRITPPFWIYVLSGIALLGIALLTVCWQTWRAASRNPVETLRYE
ncbi:MAG: ABC transporter permease [Bacteroidales bacterium]|jgi:putative ABC transport system permease protein